MRSSSRRRRPHKGTSRVRKKSKRTTRRRSSRKSRSPVFDDDYGRCQCKYSKLQAQHRTLSLTSSQKRKRATMQVRTQSPLLPSFLPRWQSYNNIRKYRGESNNNIKEEIDETYDKLLKEQCSRLKDYETADAICQHFTFSALTKWYTGYFSKEIVHLNSSQFPICTGAIENGIASFELRLKLSAIWCYVKSSPLNNKTNLTFNAIYVYESPRARLLIHPQEVVTSYSTDTSRLHGVQMMLFHTLLRYSKATLTFINYVHQKEFEDAWCDEDSLFSEVQLELTKAKLNRAMNDVDLLLELHVVYESQFERRIVRRLNHFLSVDDDVIRTSSRLDASNNIYECVTNYSFSPEEGDDSRQSPYKSHKRICISCTDYLFSNPTQGVEK